jgi:membrane carboxypeptidase/penicillin-binding protein PbpC
MVLSLVLGAGEVKLVDMVSAYSEHLQQMGFAMNQQEYFVLKTGSGKVLEEYKEDEGEPNTTRLRS